MQSYTGRYTRGVRATRAAHGQANKAKGQDSEGSDLEAAFDYYWRILAQGQGREGSGHEDQPQPVKQMKFGKWVIDRAWPEYRVAVELNGGAGGGYGRPIVCHNCGSRVRARKSDGSLGRELRLPYPSHAGQGAERDAEKINALQQAGWSILIFTSAMLKESPEACIQQVGVEIRKAKMGNGIPQVANILTPRELTVVEQLCTGGSYKDIALALGVKPETIEKHAQHIKEKMGVQSLAAMAARAVALGMVDHRIFLSER